MSRENVERRSLPLNYSVSFNEVLSQYSPAAITALSEQIFSRPLAVFKQCSTVSIWTAMVQCSIAASVFQYPI